MSDITIWIAFFGGVASFFSPCIFPLLPAYISHLTGGQLKQTTFIVNRKILFVRSIGFISGFSLIFIVFGASASYLGQLLTDYRIWLMQFSGLLIIVFGLHTAGWLEIKWLMYEKRFHVEKPSKGFFSSTLIGMAFASGWSPCVGISLSTILLLAGNTDTLEQGMFLLIAYSTGMAIPFLIISFVVSYSLRFLRLMNRQLGKIALINGIMMVALGFLVLSGQLQKISAWLAQYSLF
ncbi:cytochrome c biogenesis CcdA family protein [Exiguobacterium artemiae]|uniref:cytochrome c biogenesis CcdA family protein n=1 Tax=Exiguobacterium artemiae TaxID=340145 RepID=UPI002965162E|nr:cytochrome c biogenesis CcdA family protein [Exiguobacterium sibiricum]MDW2884677.1 cytochrome c biogenesis CcdA family protein [Exiguobacterium sibiricum]